MDVRTLPSTEVSFDLSIQLKIRRSVDAQKVKGEVQRVLSAYFNGSRLGESVLRAKLGQLIFSVDGVENYQILVPAQDVVIQLGQLPRLRTLGVEVLS